MESTALLTLYFIPSPYRIDWSSPTSVAKDIVKNKLSFSKRFMGHVNIELDYENEEGKPVHILTGMAASNLNAIPLLLKKKIGLGILFHSFPGKLETKEELVPELDKYFEKGNEAINFIRFKINKDTAKRVEKYVATYAKNNVGQYYGLVNSPLHGEGSGCSAFGASFLDVAGILEDEYKNAWTHNLKVSHKLAGAPISDSKVSFFSLLLQKHSWSDGSDDNHQIFFWDPDLMHKWVEEKIAAHNKTTNPFDLVNIKNSRGLEIDVTGAKTPTSEIFKHDTKNGIAKSPDLTNRSNYSKYNA